MFGNCPLIMDTISKAIFFLVPKHLDIVLGKLTGCHLLSRTAELQLAS
jgi:hypothetical protein